MANKTKIPDLNFEDLKSGQVYRSKKPKFIGVFERLVDDRQIRYISEHKKPVEHIDHGFTPEYLEWCKKKGAYCFPSSEINKSEYEKETDKSPKNIETIWDHVIQYDSPSVKFGKHLPTIPASKFIKWAAENVTEKLPKGEWATEL